jgi:hypothetical protein
MNVSADMQIVAESSSNNTFKNIKVGAAVGRGEGCTSENFRSNVSLLDDV